MANDHQVATQYKPMVKSLAGLSGLKRRWRS